MFLIKVVLIKKNVYIVQKGIFYRFKGSCRKMSWGKPSDQRIKLCEKENERGSWTRKKKKTKSEMKRLYTSGVVTPLTIINILLLYFLVFGM